MSPSAKPMKLARRASEERVPGFPRRATSATPEPESDTSAETATAVPIADPPVIATAAPEVTPPTEPAAPTTPIARAKPDRKSRDSAASGKAAATPGADMTKPGGHRHQTNFRLYESEMRYLKRLSREFEDDGINTNITELVHAVIYATRRGELDPLEMLRRWRTDLNEF